MKKKLPTIKKRVPEILKILKELYPSVESELNTKNPYEKVVSTILSAQCTDVRVNKITPALFEKYPDVSSLKEAKIETVQKLIFSTGFYKNKSKYLLGMANVVVDNFNGKIPKTMDELLTLPGVARKTANCVLNDCYNIPSGVVVDTHVSRLSVLIGLSDGPKSNAVKIERDLIKLFPKKEWINISHRLIYHGRRVCKARKPACSSCKISHLCKFNLTNSK
jgi:endonuclease III